MPLGKLRSETVASPVEAESGRAEAGKQQDLGVTVLDVGPGQKVSTDHLQTVPPRLVGSEHESRPIDRLFDHRSLALVDLEIDQLARF
jgi:hypothetical protein